MDEPRLFYLDRQEDATGISGTGRVAEGVMFSDGTVALRWRTSVRSTAFHDSMNNVALIHGHSGATKITWADSEGD